MKKKLKLTLPVWSILLIAAIIIGGICFVVFQFQHNPDQDQLSGLTVDSIDSIILDFELMGNHEKRELNENQIRELIPLLSRLELPGEAYRVGVIGQTKRYIVRTEDGRSFRFSLLWIPIALTITGIIYTTGAKKCQNCIPNCARLWTNTTRRSIPILNFDHTTSYIKKG